MTGRLDTRSRFRPSRTRIALPLRLGASAPLALADERDLDTDEHGAMSSDVVLDAIR